MLSLGLLAVALSVTMCVTAAPFGCKILSNPLQANCNGSIYDLSNFGAMQREYE